MMMKTTKAARPGIVPLLGLLLAIPMAGRAGPAVEVLDTVTVHESHKYGYFPSLQMLSTGELICDFSLDADTDDVEGNFWGYVISKDGGRTWGMRNTGGMLYREASYTRDPSLPDGSLEIVAGYPLPGPGDDYRNLQASSARLSAGGNTILLSRDVQIHLPQPAVRRKMDGTIHDSGTLGLGKIKEAALILFSGTTSASRDGGWLTTMYGKLEGDEFFRTIVVKADRAGKNWQYLSTIAGDEEARAALAREGEKKAEGFGEPRMVRLPDGRLLVVMRRGSNNVMYKSWSEDDGRTWSKPASLGFHGVEPALMVMKSGLLAFCTGRPEPVAVRFSADGGSTWSTPTQVAKSDEVNIPDKPYARQKSTCYTGMVEVEPGKLLIVYDHLPFVEGWGLNPDKAPTAVNSIYGTFLKVTR
ncbi:MAG: hypothetical protein JWM88_2415 [Verrucomicrobia bacterium]|nr:hypothetical protein [Verrucomicrobiota bacterium]